MEIKVAPPVHYARVYADSSGESHFAEDQVSFSLVDFAPPAPPISITDAWDGEGAFMMSSPPGWTGDWHPAPRRLLLFALKGELEVEVSDGEVRRFGPGAIVIVEDTFGKGHISRVVSDERGCMVAVPLAQRELPEEQ
jgi:hypothetical protein